MEAIELIEALSTWPGYDGITQSDDKLWIEYKYSLGFGAVIYTSGNLKEYTLVIHNEYLNKTEVICVNETLEIVSECLRYYYTLAIEEQGAQPPVEQIINNLDKYVENGWQ
jgi:hypothetical protein